MGLLILGFMIGSAGSALISLLQYFQMRRPQALRTLDHGKFQQRNRPAIAHYGLLCLAGMVVSVHNIKDLNIFLMDNPMLKALGFYHTYSQPHFPGYHAPGRKRYGFLRPHRIYWHCRSPYVPDDLWECQPPDTHTCLGFTGRIHDASGRYHFPVAGHRKRTACKYSSGPYGHTGNYIRNSEK